ncbi:MAG: DinB family protein [Anaerolineae bacterium]|nr:DinB family protein [Anaerolineae bacterium]
MMEQFFVDYLERLQTLDRDFIAAFDDLPAEALDWVPGADMNSFVVLVVHVTGSSRFWIGDAALDDPSNRNRAAEFQAKGLSHDQLKARFAALEDYARAGLERLSLADFAVTSSVVFDGKPATKGWALLHALEHLGLHLGHAQITRQLWEQR